MNQVKIEKEIYQALKDLESLNPNILGRRKTDSSQVLKKRTHFLQKVVVANRGEIAKRFFLALHEEGIPSVAVVTDPDKGQSWYEFADEVVFIGDKDNYANIPVVLAATQLVKANAIYSGYGFLSEKAEFAEAIDYVSNQLGYKIIFMGPSHQTIRMVGDKISARKLAREHDIPLFESSDILNPDDMAAARIEAERIGYPVIIKLCHGGGGKGMYPVSRESDLFKAVESSSRIGKELYGDHSFYIEKYIEKPIHIEVQIFNGWAIGIRKCAVQRRNQKIIEESGHSFVDDYISLSLLAAAEKIAHISGYSNGGGAGTVEFLFDGDRERFGFMEMNTRLQVEYAVTDQSLGIDIAKWQILFYDGREDEILGLDILKKRIADNDHSIECRIYAEEPENNYLPSPGTISELDLPTFNGIRCDFGFGEGDNILPMYDPLIGKLIAHGSDRKEALIRLERALQELYIKGVKTNISHLLKIVRHPGFINLDYTNNLLKEMEEQSSCKPEDKQGDRRGKNQIIFGALSEYIMLIQNSVRDFIVIANLGNIIDAPTDLLIPSRFTVNYDGADFTVEFIQVSIETFHTFVNGIYNGKISVISINDRSDDFLFLFGNSSYRLRVNRHADFIELRMKDEFNKINYYRMKVITEGPVEKDTTSRIIAPFQGTFIAFCSDGLGIGKRVEKGEPLFILSAMKMETVFHAPETGIITHLIEDGDLSRLQIASTADGRIIGRSIQEGELLAAIDPETDDYLNGGNTERKSSKPDIQILDKTAENILCMLSNDADVSAEVASNEQFALLLELLRAAVMGFIYQPIIIEKLITLLKQLPSDLHESIINNETIHVMNSIILHYTSIKRIFSPVLSGEELSFQEELSLYIPFRNKKGIRFSGTFEELLDSLFQAYGIDRWEGKNDIRKMLQLYVFMLFKRSYQFSLDQTDVIKKLVHILSRIKRPVRIIHETLFRLMEHEQAERDDSLLKFLKKTILEKFPENGIAPYQEIKQPLLYKHESIANFWEESRGLLLRLCSESMIVHEEFRSDLTSEIPSVYLRRRISLLMGLYRITELFSPLQTVRIFRLQPIDNPDSQSLIAFSSADHTGKGNQAGDIELAMMGLLRAVSLYQEMGGFEHFWTDLYLPGKTATWFSEKNQNCVDYNLLRSLCNAALERTRFSGSIRGIVNIDVRYPFSETVANRDIIYYKQDDFFFMEFLQGSYPSNPYRSEKDIDTANQRLLESNKWPIEFWAEECFDRGTMEEVFINSVDKEDIDSAGEIKLISRPPASKIYCGTIGGNPACFYMKDSRVSGGSTGSREGLKYVAAAYLSFLKDLPLFVWNDSAGANILEGVVSLNRGAEGFMMNTLMAEHVDSIKFSRYLENISDERLTSLFSELESQLGLSPETLDRPHRSFQLIAVGIGSSAGLDVYGSSQASIQMLLDSNQSYRVLTGSNVIYSVIGENISNYDIGGAKILGKWTGIVDVIAFDKIQMINSIRQISRIFCSEEMLGRIERPGNVDDANGKKDIVALTESTIQANVDNGFFWHFKDSYYAAGALIGGFSKIGGRRVMIMGPRTHSGLRSAASIIKARELLRTAHRTRSHQILIFGKKWQQSPDYHENISMRPRLDLISTMQKKSGVRIHIITDAEGLKCFDINSTADVIICVCSSTEPPVDCSFAEKNSTFMADSIAGAFDLALKLIDLIDPLSLPTGYDEPDSEPRIPSDTAEPYDMIECIIRPVFDRESFLEFYREMNNPIKGPSLITGLARLCGRTVGIIADQPLYKGGGADAFGTEKFRIFTDFLNRNSIPLVMLSNSSGFVPGSKQERYRIQAIGAESLDVNILGEIPVVSVVLNQNYGGRLIHAFNKFLRPGITFLALEQSVMAVLGVDAAFDLLFGKKYSRLLQEGKHERAEELKAGFFETYIDKARSVHDGVDSKLVDWTIPGIGGLRESLIRGLNSSFQRCRVAFGSHWDDIKT